LPPYGRRKAHERRQLFELLPFDFDFFEERFAPTLPDLFVAEVRLDAAAARCVLPLLFVDFFAERFAPPRADERAADFFVERVADLAADFLAPDRAFDVDFFAAFLVAFLAVFLVAFFVVFLAELFELVLLEVLAADFLAVFAALFLAPVLADFLPLFEPRFFAVDDPDPLEPPPRPVLMSLGFDLSSVGIAASFKGLRVHRHACTRQRRYIKRVPSCEKRQN
jgi:hypothetical protein